MIKIRNIENLNELIVKRDKQRQKVVEANAKIREEYEQPFLEAKKKASKFSYLWFYILLGYIFVLLLAYKKLHLPVFYMTAIIVGVIILILIAYPIYLHKKKRDKKKEWEKEVEKTNPLLESTKYLNNEVSKTAVAIIALSENYYDLETIEDNKTLNQRWLIILSEYIDSINSLYNNKATSEDYYSYFLDWKYKVTE